MPTSYVFQRYLIVFNMLDCLITNRLLQSGPIWCHKYPLLPQAHHPGSKQETDPTPTQTYSLTRVDSKLPLNQPHSHRQISQLGHPSLMTSSRIPIQKLRQVARYSCFMINNLKFPDIKRFSQSHKIGSWQRNEVMFPTLLDFTSDPHSFVLAQALIFHVSSSAGAPPFICEGITPEMSNARENRCPPGWYSYSLL